MLHTCICGCGRTFVSDGHGRRYYSAACSERLRYRRPGRGRDPFGCASILRAWKQHYQAATELEFRRKFDKRERAIAEGRA
jgi:hypothetical protein